jgi:hypothetical protein
MIFFGSVDPFSTDALRGCSIAPGAPIAPRRRPRLHHCRRCFSCAYPVFEPRCNFVFYGGRPCNLVA